MCWRRSTNSERGTASGEAKAKNEVRKTNGLKDGRAERLNNRKAERLND
jgi:hypothetical protein